MSLFVDTSVWSLALRRDRPRQSAEVGFLARALRTGEPVITTGLVLQELLQGFREGEARDRIVERFSALPFVVPDRQDHVRAAELQRSCRLRGVAIGAVDALLAALCIRRELTMLAADADFARAAEFLPLDLWRA